MAIDQTELKNIKADVGQMPRTWFDPMPVVTATLEDGSTVELFSYYPDELSFPPFEFEGLTVEEGRRLKFERYGVSQELT